LVSLVEDEIRDEKRTDHTLRLAARVVRPNYSWTNGPVGDGGERLEETVIQTV